MSMGKSGSWSLKGGKTGRPVPDGGMAGGQVSEGGSTARHPVLEVAVPVALLVAAAPAAGTVRYVSVPAGAAMANLLTETMSFVLVHQEDLPPGPSSLTMRGVPSVNGP